MRYTLFGRGTGLKVSSMILGTGMLGDAGGYRTAPEDVPAILRGYAEAGGNFIDTSDAYQQGQSDRKAMVQSVEASLKRLKTDRIDLYLNHMDYGSTSVEEIARGFDNLVRAGKIIYAGFSNTPAWRLATAAATADVRGWAPIAAMQVEYGLLQRTTERDLLPMADAIGMGVMGYSPLAAGLLTGKYRRGGTGRETDFKASVSHEDAGASATVIDTLIAVADELGVSPGQVAIAWVIAKGVFPIVGPRTPAQHQENLAAATLALGAEHLRRLDEVSAVPAGYPHELLLSIAAPVTRKVPD